MPREVRDAANNARVMRELEGVPAGRRGARFVCCMCLVAASAEGRGQSVGQNAILPDAAAYAINELVRPRAVIVSHPNEGATSGGIIRPNTRTKSFVDQVKNRPVYLGISGRTLEFDGSGTCMAGGCY